MNVVFLNKLIHFLVLVLIQVLVLNHIHLLGVATPLLYVYFILNFSYNYPRWASMLWAFIMGIIIDIFSNTPGIASASLTLLAAIQPHILRPFIMHDDTSDIEPNITVLTYSRYIGFASIMTFIYSIVFFTLEMFSFFNIVEWISCVIGSTVLTIALILVIERMRSRL